MNPGFSCCLSRVRFAFLNEVTVKISALCDLLPSALVDKSRRFGEHYNLPDVFVG